MKHTRYCLLSFLLMPLANGMSLEEQLAQALEKNKLAQVRELIKGGAKVNAIVTTNISGKNYDTTLLNFTIYHQRSRGIVTLIKNGADIYQKDTIYGADARGTAHNAACKLDNSFRDYSDIRINKKITKACKIYTYLQGLNFFYTIRQSANKAQLQKVGEQIRENPHFYATLVNVIEPKTGQTPLHAAVLHGDIGLIDELIRCGADSTIKDHSGKTALKLAEERDYAAYQHLLSVRIRTLIDNYAESDEPIKDMPKKLQKRILRLLKKGASLAAKDPI